MLKVIKIEKILPNEFNFKRKTKKQLDELKASLNDGIIGHNIVVDKNNKIILGQNIYKMAIEIGLKELECEVWDGDESLSKEEMNIVDNASAEVATWDKKMARSEIHKLGDDKFALYDMSFLKEKDKVVKVKKKEDNLKEMVCPTCNYHFKIKK